MGLEEELADILAKEMAREIDEELMSDMMVAAMGWTKVKNHYYYNNRHAVDIANWLEENCQGEYKRMAGSFLFELEKDATMFILRWS